MSLPDQAPSSPSTATMLGKYKILRVIARSNDVVYEAIDPGMGRRVAVKELAMSQSLSGQQRRERIERFYREAKAAGNLSHPNIVTVHEVGHDGDRHYIAMEYLEGPSLRDILRMRASLPIKEALTVALQLTDALGYAHAQGVVHRDVKPDNIHLILPNDSVKLTDFGIARILADPAITSTGQVFGTPSYMSPEQILSKDVDHRTDIFSLGVVLYEMIVGKKPFGGDSVITITYHVMNSQPAIPTNLPSGVYNLISRALTKDPNLRYQSMASMAADLHTELAFSDSAYRLSIAPGLLTAQQLADEHTAMIDRPDLGRETSGPAPVVPKYAPATGMSEAVTGGPVTAAKTVTPVVLPTVRSNDDASKSALTLVGSIVAVMLVVLALAIVVAKAYVADKIEKQRLAAMQIYNKAGNELLLHQYDQALADYQLALSEAPKGSQVAVFAKSAIAQLQNRQENIENSDSAVSPEVASLSSPDSAISAPIASGNGVPTTSGPPAAPIQSGSDAATADLASGQDDLAKGDETDAIPQFVAANTSDPTGDAGKRAGLQLAQIYSDRAEQAMHSGQVQTALDDWQLVVKYAPADPLADDARQKILENATSGTPPAATSGSNESTSAPTGT